MTTVNQTNQLSKQACENESQLRSLEGGAATSVNFVNKTSALVKVYWINYQGQRQLYKDLKSGESYTQSTYVHHPWVVTDEQGGCLGIFQPESERKDAIIEAFSGQGQGTSTQAPSPESSQTSQIGKIVVNADEWTLSNTGFTQAPDTATFVTNIAKWFTGGRSTGKFHAYSTNFGLTESVLAQTIAKAGYTWTTGKIIKFDLPTLLTYDGIFLCGDLADNQVLIDYVKAGGNVYLGAGTGAGGPQQEADRWNTFLNAFGLKLLGVYNEISGNQPVNSSHPIFAGVKAIYQNNGNSIVDLDPASETTELLLTHTTGQGLIAVTVSEKTSTLSSKPTESSQTQTPLNNVQIGKIVVNADEWTLSNTGFTQAPDTATFVTNIAKWFTGGRSTGKFHAYSTNFGLTESVLAQTIAKAGYTWTTGKIIKFDLPTLLTYDGIFLCGDLADNQVLIDYVKAGGNVYLGAGTGAGGPQQEADRWNTFLNAFGLKLLGVYNEISGNQPVNSSHPIFAGVKAIYQNNGNSIVDLDPASETTELLLTHTTGQGLIAVTVSEKTSTLSSKPTESSQTQTPLNNVQIGKIVVNADEWTLSNTGFTQAPDTATFVTNIAKWFTGGRSTGKFHAYSTNFGLTESVLAQTIAKAGYTWTTGKIIKFDLPTLLTYDGIFLCGDLADNQVLIDYVKAGGNVYLGAGTGAGGPQQEADRWNTFLNAFGLKLLGVYNEISGNQPVNSSHPIFAGVKAIYQNNGNSIVDLDPASQTNQILLTHTTGQGLIAVAVSDKTNTLSSSELTGSSQTQTLWQIGKPGKCGKDFVPAGGWQQEFTYTVGVDRDPVNESSMPFLLVKPGLTPKPEREGKPIPSTDKLNIRFVLERNYDEGELILFYDFFGSEIDTLFLDGKNLIQILGEGEGKLKQNQIPLGALAQGEHTLTIVTDRGTGSHWIDCLRLLLKKSQEINTQESKQKEKKEKKEKKEEKIESKEEKIEKKEEKLRRKKVNGKKQTLLFLNSAAKRRMISTIFCKVGVGF
ncbi:hypothetical protein F7734_04780 [Scytonema sp. UIC 10036]|uniref:VHL beta domain-containing protein n=1 Tax=Scytonema sp. UIC 10036 TaxID=2304196 RepID=UPI0012DA4D62|nr:hypothetical protein [Scytonema sp. UIC 10036]MUG91822.1 hypothetical protein [Scytonema sp. UIC 10036]